MSAEALAHGREKLFRKRVLAARTEAGIEGCGKNIGRHCLLNGGQQRPAPFARILDYPGKVIELRVRGKGACGEVKKPRADHTSAPPYFGNVGDIETELLAFGTCRVRCILEDIESLGIGLHKAVFDAVMNHLDEVTRAIRSGVDVATLSAGIAAIAFGGSRYAARAGGERRKDGIEPFDDLLFAADHHAIAALEAPHAAAGADVHVMQLTLTQHFGAADIVAPERVAAVDDHIAGLQPIGKRFNGIIGDGAGRQHHPDGARRRKLTHQLVEAGGGCGSIAGKGGDGGTVAIKYHWLMPVLHQPSRDVAAHAAKSNDSDLHGTAPVMY